MSAVAPRGGTENRESFAQDRLVVLDSLRGLCALLVALHHFKASGFLADNAFILHAYLFVDFFFVLSGYVIAMTYRRTLGDAYGVRTYLVKRFARIYPLYILTLVPFICIELFVIPLFPGWREPFVFPVDPESLLLTVLLLNSVGLTGGLSWNYPSWSISGEILAYTWFAAAVFVSGRYMGLVLATIAASALGWIMLTSTRFMDVTHELGAVRCAVGFAIGALLWEGRRHYGGDLRPAMPVSARGRLIATMLEAAALGAVLTFVVWGGGNELSYAAPVLFAGVIMLFAREGGWVSRLLSFRCFVLLGTWSYSIYLVHAFWASRVFSGGLKVAESRGLDLLDDATGRFGSTGTEGNLLTLVYVAAVIATAALSYRFIEKPGQALVTWLFAPQRMLPSVPGDAQR